MPGDTPQTEFERESSRLSDGLKSCRSVLDNYRAMMGGDQHGSDEESSDLSNYLSTTGSTAQSYDDSSAT